MLLHGAAREFRVVRADGAIDLAVHLGGFLEVLRVLNGFGAAFVETGGDRLHKSAENRIACGAGNGAVEANVVNQELPRSFERCIHLGDLFSKFSNMFARSSLGSQRSQVGLDHNSRLEHLFGEETVQDAQNRKGT